MKSRHELKDGIYWISYADDSTFEMASDLIEIVTPTIHEAELEGVILDLRGVNMLNSSGIGLLIEFFKETSEKNLIFVAITNDYVYRTLGLIGFEGVFQMVESREQALREMQAEISKKQDLI